MNKEDIVNILWYIKDVFINSFFFVLSMIAVVTLFTNLSPVWLAIVGVVLFILFYKPLVKRIARPKERDGFSSIIYKFKRPVDQMKFKIVEETYSNAWLDSGEVTYFYALVQPYYFAGYFAIKNTNLFSPIYPPYREVMNIERLKLHYTYRSKSDAEAQIEKFKEYALDQEKKNKKTSVLKSKTTKL